MYNEISGYMPEPNREYNKNDSAKSDNYSTTFFNIILIIISNILVIFYAFKLNIHLVNLLVVYWVQTLFVFIFIIIKIINLRDFTVSDYYRNKIDKLAKSKYLGVNSKVINPGSKKEILSNLFSVMTISFLIYGVFIYSMFGFDNLNTNYVINCCLIFLVSNIISSVYNLFYKKPVEYIELYFNQATSRILPLHIILLGGSYFIGRSVSPNIITITLIFCGLKTLVEVGAEHMSYMVNNVRMSNSTLKDNS